MRKTENEEANNIMLEFFIKCRAQNIPMTGPMLQAMVGWKRFGVGTMSTSGHYVVNLPMSTKKAADDWKRHLPTVVEGCAAEDQFSAYETAVFYWQLMKSVVFKGESCKGSRIFINALVFLCQYDSTSAPQPYFIYLLLILSATGSIIK